MSKKICRAALTAALTAVAAPGLCAGNAPSTPARENLIAKILPWVGAPSTRMPKGLLLQQGSLIVAIGDSITEAGGYLRDIDTALAELYPALQLPGIINAGISGQKAEDLVERFQRDVVDRKPAVVTLSIGINDVWHRLGKPHDENVLKAYKANVAQMVDMAQTNGIKVILLTPTLIKEEPKAEGNRRLARYVEAMQEIALEKKCGLADLHAMFLEALKHKPDGLDGNWLTQDGVHTRPPGNAVMAIGVLRALDVPDRDIARLK